jgi:hypothetical protein
VTFVQSFPCPTDTSLWYLIAFRLEGQAEACPVTVDEELNLLEQHLRRLKIEYEIYFNNPSKKPPTDIEWKVLAALRKFSDGSKMNFSQRFRFNEMAQRYAIYSDLWRKKTRIREEGYRRPQDALLSVQGVRAVEEQPAPPQETYEVDDRETSVPLANANPGAPTGPFTVQCSNADRETDKVQSLFRALVDAKRKAGEAVGDSSNLDSFSSFVKNKTAQIRKQYGCEAVEYSVELEGGKVRLKAKAKA